jgi:Aromatic-ring-opening dioxygenase LigAB, LigA subunit
MKAEERQRFVQDMDAMLNEYQLRPQEMVAVKTLDPLKVAGAGAHPILAWTAVHLIAADMRAQGRKVASSESVSHS